MSDAMGRRKADKKQSILGSLAIVISVLTATTSGITVFGYMKNLVASKQEIKKLSTETEILKIELHMRVNNINMRWLENREKMTPEQLRKYEEYKKDNAMLRQMRFQLISSSTLIED